MDDLLLPSLHATNEAEAQQRLNEFGLVDDGDFAHAGISVQFSCLNKNRGTVKNGSYASGLQSLCALAS
ncbi:MAG: hypothetical protein JWM21_1236 [Acidobacteria bacterium]|nr:hypothetical protein [Acidobacteriota bacterium]